MQFYKKISGFIFIMLVACSENPNIYISNGQGCIIDNIKIKNQTLQYLSPINNNSEIIINGWVANLAQLKIPNKVSLSIADSNGKYYLLGSTSLSVERKDVGSNFKNEIFNGSGFSLNAKIENIKPGKYTFHMAAIYDEENTVCIPNNYREIIIN